MCVHIIYHSQFSYRRTPFSFHLCLTEIRILTCFQDDKAQVIQTLLLSSGINTLLQTLFGTRLPAVMGGSYTFLIPILTIINSASFQSIDSDQKVCV